MQLLFLQLCKHRLLCLLIGTFACLKRRIRFRKVVDDTVKAIVALTPIFKLYAAIDNSAGMLYAIRGDIGTTVGPCLYG